MLTLRRSVSTPSVVTLLSSLPRHSVASFHSSSSSSPSFHCYQPHARSRAAAAPVLLLCKVPSRALSRSSKTQLGIASIVTGIVLLGGSQGLMTVAKGAVFGVGSLALLAGAGVFLVQRRLRQAVTLAAMAQSGAHVCAQFLTDNESRLMTEIGVKPAHAVLSESTPHGDDGDAVAMHFSLLATHSPDVAPDVAAADAAWHVSFVVRFDPPPSRATGSPSTEPVGRIVEATLHGERTVDLLDRAAGEPLLPHQRKLGAIDAEFVDMSSSSSKPTEKKQIGKKQR
jgi:hypothetical protein